MPFAISNRQTGRGRKPRPSLRADGDRNDLALSALDFARGIVRRHWNHWRLWRVGEVADAVQVAHVGLLRAAELFDASRGVPFAGYARSWVQSALFLACHDAALVYYPHHHAMPRRRVRLVPRFGEKCDADVPPEPEAPGDPGLAEEADAARSLILSGLPRLTAQQRAVVRGLLGGLTGADIARRMGLSRARVSALRAEATRALRDALGNRAEELL